jgi:WD40 repeat protein
VRVRASGCALLLVACAPALAPLPPLPPVGLTLADEAQQAFGPGLPADARLVRVPAWATLHGVWGTYDPPLYGEYGELVQVAFRPDGRTMVLLGRHGQLFFWDRMARAIRGRIDSCAEPYRPEAALVSDPAHLLVTSPEGLAAVGFRSGRYCVVDLSTGKVTAKIDANDLVAGCQGLGLMSASLASGKLVTYGYTWAAAYPTPFGDESFPACGGQLRSWDARSGAQLSDTTPDGAWTEALSPDGERFAMIPVQGQSILDEVRMLSRTGQVLWVRKLPQKTTVHRLVFATSDVLLATDGDRLFSMSARDGALLGFFEERDPPLPRNPLYPDLNNNAHANIAVTSDGRHAVTDTASWITVWDVGARREVARASVESEDVFRHVGLGSLTPSPGGSFFASSSMTILSTTTLNVVEAPGGPLGLMAASADAQRVIAWRMFQGKEGFDVWDGAARTLRRWPGLTWKNLWYGASDVALPGDGARAAVRGGSELVELREWSSGGPLWITPRGPSDAAIFSPDGGAMATLRSVRDDPPRYWATLATLLDAATGSVLWQHRLVGPGPHHARFFGRDGRTVVISDANDLVVLDAHDGSVLHRVGPLEAGTWTRAGDTRALVVGEKRRSIASYDLETGKQVWRTNEGRGNWDGSTLVVALPDGKAFVEANESLIRRRNVESGADLGDPIDLGPSADAPRQLAVSSDGRTLLVGTRRGVILRFGLTQ